jgi:hypothetical protein
MLRGDVELGGGVPSGAVEQQNGVGAVGDMARDFLEMSRESAAPTPRAGKWRRRERPFRALIGGLARPRFSPR